jgi:hypothetical protein
MHQKQGTCKVCGKPFQRKVSRRTIPKTCGGPECLRIARRDGITRFMRTIPKA